MTDAKVDAPPVPQDDNGWRTPLSVLAGIAADLAPGKPGAPGFDVDAAASEANALAPVFFDGTEGCDGLLSPWTSDGTVGGDPCTVWCNPPYNPKGSVEAWLKKGLAESGAGLPRVGGGVLSGRVNHGRDFGSLVVMLVPMATSTAWFNELVVPFAEWHSFKGRIAFVDPHIREPTPKEIADWEADCEIARRMHSVQPPKPTTPRSSPKQDNCLVIYRPQTGPFASAFNNGTAVVQRNRIGHTAVRDAKTGKVVWRKP